MKSKQFAVFLLIPLMLVGCNLGCDVETAISGGLAGQLATTLNCQNQAAIQEDVKSILNVTNLCEVKKHFEDKKLKEGTIASIVCPFAASAAVAYLGSKVPTTWQCSPAAAQTSLQTAVTAACELLPF